MTTDASSLFVGFQDHSPPEYLEYLLQFSLTVYKLATQGINLLFDGSVSISCPHTSLIPKKDPLILEHNPIIFYGH